LHVTARRARVGLAEVTAYCRSRPGASATTPFGPSPLVFKAAGRMFALIGHHDERPVISLKADPERSLLLRTSFAAITPGYHLNKEHWNTLVLDGSLPASLVTELIDHSHDLVVRMPPQRVRKSRRPTRTKGGRGSARPSR
jgi:predicted DNA-binding protein (MmcQ/YjbR family)